MGSKEMSNRQNFFVLIFLTQSIEVKRGGKIEHLPFKVHLILFEVHIVLQNESNARGSTLPLAPVGLEVIE